MDGRFDADNLISIDLDIYSPVSRNVHKVLSFKIDTGFTNDLCMTYDVAFPLALSLVGVQDYQIADGSNVQWFECVGMVKRGRDYIPVTVSVRPTGSLLMGMSLMRKLGSRLEVDFGKSRVRLVTPRKKSR